MDYSKEINKAIKEYKEYKKSLKAKGIDEWEDCKKYLKIHNIDITGMTKNACYMKQSSLWINNRVLAIFGNIHN